MAICWVANCNHYGEQNTCKMYKFPTDSKTRMIWIKNLRRADQPNLDQPTQHIAVCSCHFKNGEKKNHPTIFKHIRKDKRFNFYKLSGIKRVDSGVDTLSMRKKLLTGSSVLAKIPKLTEPLISSNVTSSFMENVIGSTDLNRHLTDRYPFVLGANSTRSSNNSQSLTSNCCYSCEALTVQNQLLKCKIEDLHQKLLSKVRFTFSVISDSDKNVFFYTGLLNASIFHALRTHLMYIPIKYHAGWDVTNVSKEDQLFITLIKLKTNMPFEDIACRFSLSKATVCNIFLTWLHLLHEVLFERFMKKLPTTEQVNLTRPNCFYQLRNCRVIISCINVYTTSVKHFNNKEKTSESIGNYKSTFKGVLCVSPNGVIVYASDLYEKSISDGQIIQHCGVLDQLKAGDLVMAEQELAELIPDISPSGVNVISFLSTTMLKFAQKRQIGRIEKVHLHLEKAVKRLYSFSILKFITAPLLSELNTIFQVCSALCNLQWSQMEDNEINV